MKTSQYSAGNGVDVFGIGTTTGGLVLGKKEKAMEEQEIRR